MEKLDFAVVLSDEKTVYNRNGANIDENRRYAKKIIDYFIGASLKAHRRKSISFTYRDRKNGKLFIDMILRGLDKCDNKNIPLNVIDRMFDYVEDIINNANESDVKYSSYSFKYFYNKDNTNMDFDLSVKEPSTSYNIMYKNLMSKLDSDAFMHNLRKDFNTVIELYKIHNYKINIIVSDFDKDKVLENGDVFVISNLALIRLPHEYEIITSVKTMSGRWRVFYTNYTSKYISKEDFVVYTMIMSELLKGSRIDEIVLDGYIGISSIVFDKEFLYSNIIDFISPYKGHKSKLGMIKRMVGSIVKHMGNNAEVREMIYEEGIIRPHYTVIKSYDDIEKLEKLFATIELI